MENSEEEHSEEEELAPQNLIEDIKSTQSQLAEAVEAVVVAEDAEEDVEEGVEEDNAEDENQEKEDDDQDENEERDPGEGNQDTGTVTAPKEKLTQLPLARVKKLIKNGDPEWKGGSQDAQLMIVFAAERFCAQLADRVWETKVRQTGRKTVQLRDLTSYVDNDVKYEYLEGALTGKSGCLHGLTK